MTISSRTPEGGPNRCPVCGHTFRIEPSRPLGDAPCPACATLLWFVTGAAAARFFDPEAAGLIELVAARLASARPRCGPSGWMSWAWTPSMSLSCSCESGSADRVAP